MGTFRVVPDSLREREPLNKGKSPVSETSKALLDGRTIFLTTDKSTGSIYTLAKHHGKRARTKKTELNGEVGILAWFEDNE